MRLTPSPPVLEIQALVGIALFSDSTGNFNTGVGAGALTLNNGSSNTAVGTVALLLNTTGTNNTAVGTDALLNNDNTGASLGNINTAVGSGALQNNIDGDSNTAVGAFALFSENATGGFPNGVSNNAIGRDALAFDTTGSFNEAMGVNALIFNDTGSGNIAIGDDALFNNVSGSGNTGVGGAALVNATGSQNTALGTNAGVNQGSGSNNIYIGDTGSDNESNVIAIGALAATGTAYTDCFIGGIFGNPNPGVAVFIDSAGHLSTTASSARFKDDIKPMANASESIFALKPVTFRYKKEYNVKGAQQFGLVAEEVAKVNPDLVFLGRDGKPYTVRYEQVNAMLLNEFLKEHKKVQEQQASIAELKSTVTQQQKGMEVLTAQLKEQAAQIQKVNAQLEVNKPAPQVVLSKP